MGSQIEIRAVSNALQLFESVWESIHDVHGGLAVVSQLISRYVVKLKLRTTNTLLFPPVQPHLDPLVVPVFVFTGLNEKFQLHLLELAHTEDKVSGCNFVAERLADLGDTEG